MPLCSPFPGYLSVLVMDNARIHHGDQILELADRFRWLFIHILLPTMADPLVSQRFESSFFLLIHQTSTQLRKPSPRSKHLSGDTDLFSLKKVTVWCLT